MTPLPPSSIIGIYSATGSQDTTFRFISVSAPFTATAAPLPLNSSTVPFVEGDEAPLAVVVGVPICIAMTVLAVCFFLGWRRVHPSSFQGFVARLPGHTTLSRWSATRKGNTRTRTLRRPRVLSGDYHNFTGGDVYLRRIQQYQREAVRSQVTSPAPTYDISRGPDSSRWTPGARPRNLTDETASLESWEETWFTMGSGADGSMSSTTRLKAGEQDAEGRDNDGQKGPGQSWRKLI